MENCLKFGVMEISFIHFKLRASDWLLKLSSRTSANHNQGLNLPWRSGDILALFEQTLACKWYSKT